MEEGLSCSDRPPDLCQADARGRISSQHISFDEFSLLDCQRKEVVVGFDFVVSEHSDHLLCLFGMVKGSVSRGAL